MLTHEQIMKASLIATEESVVIDYDKETETAVIVTAKAACNPEYYNLLRSAAVMYQTIEHEFNAVQAIIELCEELGAEGIVPTLLNMQQGLFLAKRIAVEGFEAVADSFNKGAGI